MEDDDSFREGAVFVLERLGYGVVSARDPEGALRAALDTPIDLVLIDILLPLMSGLELASKISEIRASMRILYMSSCVDRRALAAVTPRQLIDFIEKPFQADDLIRKTRGILARPLPRFRRP